MKSLCEGIGPFQDGDSWGECSVRYLLLWIVAEQLKEKKKGDGGIRTHEGVTLGGFQDRCLKPLGHLSARAAIARRAKSASETCPTRSIAHKTQPIPRRAKQGVAKPRASVSDNPSGWDDDTR